MKASSLSVPLLALTLSSAHAGAQVYERNTATAVTENQRIHNSSARWLHLSAKCSAA